MCEADKKLVQWTNFPPNARSVSAGLNATAIVSFLLLLSGCDKLPVEAEEARSKAFFDHNKPAYEALEEALRDIDPEIKSLMACNTDTTDCFVRIEEPTTAQIEAEARYVPLIRDLGFPGHIFFDQHEGGEFVLPNMGHAEIETENGIYEVSLELVLWRNGVPADAAMC
ncbi:MAG: hypothetical protein WA989_00680, partial [Henriciella sp.]|uniref:hypothetical protein n=1 Tax=Henriciella sp. TaxID=1968823 RepID=UPI003C72CB9C